MKIGTPIIKLKPRGTAKSQGKHGAVDKIINEMCETRHTSSLTYDSTRSHLNMYKYTNGVNNAEELIAKMEQQYEQDWNDKTGGKAVRKDACYGFSGLIKPPAEELNKMTQEDQNKFLHDAFDCYVLICREHNIKLDGIAIHRDEEGQHMHVVGHSKTFDVQDYHSLKFKADLNTKLPQMMREKGWKDVEDCARDRSKPKAKHGIDVNEYRKRAIKAQTDDLKAQAEKYALEAAKAKEEANKALRDVEKQKATLQLVNSAIARTKADAQHQADIEFQKNEDKIQAQKQVLADLGKSIAKLTVDRRDLRVSSLGTTTGNIRGKQAENTLGTY